MLDYLEKICKHPHKLHEILEELKATYGEEVEEFFKCHIDNEEVYNKFVSEFKNFDGTKGGHWTPEQVKSITVIPFDTKEYTLYDFAYIVNMLYSDNGDLLNTDTILKMAQRYLEDADYYGDPADRAYHDGKKRYKYFKEATNG